MRPASYLFHGLYWIGSAVDTGKRILGLFLFMLAAVVFQPASKAATEIYDEVAARLLSPLPAGARVAALPMRAVETGLPEAVVNDINSSLFDSLLASMESGKVEFVEREHLERLIQEAEEFLNFDISEVIANAAADIALVCSAAPMANGLELNCRASEVVSGRILSHGSGQLAFGQLSQVSIALDVAITQIALELSQSTQHSQSVINNGFINQSNGRIDTLGAYIGRRVQEELVARAQKNREKQRRSSERASALTGSTVSQPDVETVLLDGVIWNLHDGFLEIEASVYSNGQKVGTSRSRVSLAQIPERLKSGVLPTGVRPYFEAEGVATISRNFPERPATNAAYNLARARIVGQALGLRGPHQLKVESHADAASVISWFSFGIPYDEKASISKSRDNVRVSLKARVGKIGVLDAPATTARLSDLTFRAMQPVIISIASESPAFIGVFALSADNAVSRIYPYAEIPTLIVGAGERISLPKPNEQSLVAAPLPGNDSDHEAIIVVSSGYNLPFESLAPPIGTTIELTGAQAMSFPDFLNDLAQLNLSQVNVTFLPYQVIN